MMCFEEYSGDISISYMYRVALLQVKCSISLFQHICTRLDFYNFLSLIFITAQSSQIKIVKNPKSTKWTVYI